MTADTPTTPACSGNDTDWWRQAVVYQVYPRSFADGNGDGTGDIAGIRNRLPYLRELGVDAIWISPWYLSPLRDGGYDVTDFRDIDPRFGSLADAEGLLADAHHHGIRVIVDIVPNHTSSDHEWFQAAVAAGPGSPERQRYHFRTGRGDGTLPPTDWPSVFGGPAWTRLNDDEGDGEWYLHLFDPSQPDVNWENPEVNDEFDDILRFWLDRGVDGFRVDVAHGLVKDPEWKDLGDRPQHVSWDSVDDHPFWDRDGLHVIYRRWRSILNEYSGRMMVAEASVHATRRPAYLRPDEFQQAFDFDLLGAAWNAKEFTSIIEHAVTSTAAVGSNATWVLSNHDVVRHPTRYGLPEGTNLDTWSLTGDPRDLDEERGERRARSAALITLALPGSAYVYQGEELGLPEVWDLPVEVLDDPVWTRSGHTEKGRDGCRVPIPWTVDGPSFGFGAIEPWLPQPADFARRSVEAQVGNATSTLELYRRAIQLRNDWFRADEAIQIDDLGPDVLAFTRGSGVRCVVNMGAQPMPLPAGDVLLASAPIDGQLRADTAVWIGPADTAQTPRTDGTDTPQS